MLRRSFEAVPSYLLEANLTPEKLTASTSDQGTEEKDRMLFEEGKKEKELISHGFQVYEDSDTGVIWEVEGNWIVKKDTDEDQAVRRNLKKKEK